MSHALRRASGTLGILSAYAALVAPAPRGGRARQEPLLPLGCWTFHVPNLPPGPLAGVLARGWIELRPEPATVEPGTPVPRGHPPHALRLWDPEVVGLWPDYGAWYPFDGDSVAIMLSLAGEFAHFRVEVGDSALTGVVRRGRWDGREPPSDSTGTWQQMSASRRRCRGT
jgi:hypothetical protein